MLRFLIFIIVLSIHSYASGAAPIVRFDSAHPPNDHMLYQPSVGDSEGRWTIDETCLHGIVPAGGAKRSPLKWKVDARLEGDFSIAFHYRIHDTPRSKAKSSAKDSRNNVELFIAGADGFASAFHSITPKDENWGYYVKPAAGKEVFFQIPATDRTATLEIRRVGKTLTFHLRGGEIPGMQIGPPVDFGDSPIHELSLQLFPYQSPDAIDASFDEFSIHADRFVRLRDQSGGGSYMVIGMMILVVLSIGAFWALRRKFVAEG